MRGALGLDPFDNAAADRPMVLTPTGARIICFAFAHDPEKWKPVFRKDHAPLNLTSVDRFN